MLNSTLVHSFANYNSQAKIMSTTFRFFNNSIYIHYLIVTEAWRNGRQNLDLQISATPTRY